MDRIHSMTECEHWALSTREIWGLGEPLFGMLPGRGRLRVAQGSSCGYHSRHTRCSTRGW